MQEKHKQIPMQGELREEILYWRFLGHWQGHLPSFDERHILLKFHASNSGWEGGDGLPPWTGSHHAPRLLDTG